MDELRERLFSVTKDLQNQRGNGDLETTSLMYKLQAENDNLRHQVNEMQDVINANGKNQSFAIESSG